MQDIWDRAKRIRVSMNKAKGQKRRLETTSPFRATSIFSVQTILHLNTYITFSNASNQVYCASPVIFCLTHNADRIYHVFTQVSN